MTNKKAIFALIEYRRRLEKDYKECGYCFDAEPFDMAIKALEQSERKTGHWVITSKFTDCYYAHCDRCNVTQVFYFGKPTTNYCPECGAKMVERREE